MSRKDFCEAVEDMTETARLCRTLARDPGAALEGHPSPERDDDDKQAVSGARARSELLGLIGFFGLFYWRGWS